MIPPMAAEICSSLVAPKLELPITPHKAEIKAKELPKKVGILPPVQR